MKIIFITLFVLIIPVFSTAQENKLEATGDCLKCIELGDTDLRGESCWIWFGEGSEVNIQWYWQCSNGIPDPLKGKYER